MKFDYLHLLSVLLVSSLFVVSGEKSLCLNFEPMPVFKMEKFIGQWFALKTTFSTSRCLEYEFYTQEIKNYTEYVAGSEFTYIFGALEANPKLPSAMTYGIYGEDYSNLAEDKPSIVVFDTDYVSYAVIYMCTNGKDFDHFVTILSRSKLLDNEVVERLLQKIYTVHDFPRDTMKLDDVDHKDCVPESMRIGSNDQNVIKDGKTYVSIKGKSKYVSTT